MTSPPPSFIFSSTAAKFFSLASAITSIAPAAAYRIATFVPICELIPITTANSRFKFSTYSPPSLDHQKATFMCLVPRSFFKIHDSAKNYFASKISILVYLVNYFKRAPNSNPRILGAPLLKICSRFLTRSPSILGLHHLVRRFFLMVDQQSKCRYDHLMSIAHRFIFMGRTTLTVPNAYHRVISRVHP